MSVVSSTVPDVAAGKHRILAPGQVVFSRFTLRRMLGQGGMAAVWLAHDSQLDRQVALKFVADPHFRDPGASAELRRETRRSLELTHPNIIRIYDYLEDDTAAAISLEYVDGSTLARLRVEQADGVFNPEDLNGWLAGVCAALEYAHDETCTVHRDLKPSNIIVTSRNVAKIADFGISCGLQNTAARISAWSTATGGTLGYMSPQQLHGDLAAPSDDIYSLGATIYELLTGKPPFYTGDISFQVREIVADRMDDRRAKLGINRPELPELWIETIAACLAKEPEDRPATIGELAERLGIKAGENVQMGTASDVERTLRFAPLQRRAEQRTTKRQLTFNQWFVVAIVVPVITGWFLWPNTTREFRNPVQAATAATVPINVEAKAAPPGGILIKTAPTGASVMMDGKPVGITPLTINQVPAGERPVTVEMPGFEATTVKASVRANEFTDMGTIPLTRSVGSLLVQTEPQDCAYALLSADGATEIRRGRTPEQVPNLPTGTYRVRFERSGWPAAESTAEVTRQATGITSHRFGTGRMEIVTNPPGAEIRMGEKVLGVSPVQTELPAGDHRKLTASLAGYQTTSFDVKVLMGESIRTAPIALAAQSATLSVVSIPDDLRYQVFAGAVLAPGAAPLQEGITPALLEKLAPGQYTVVINSPPWPVSSKVVQVGSQALSEVVHTLPSGTLHVTSQPEGATVMVNGKDMGKTPMEVVVPIGGYEVGAVWKGRPARVRSVELGDDESENIRFDFTTSTSTRSKTKRVRRPVKESVFTKVGRSIQNLFTGSKKRR
jgi:hypothetical protein